MSTQATLPPEDARRSRRAGAVLCSSVLFSDSWALLINGDCLEELPQIKCDAVVCDPPYGVTKLEWDCLVKPEWVKAFSKSQVGLS